MRPVLSRGIGAHRSRAASCSSSATAASRRMARKAAVTRQCLGPLLRLVPDEGAARRWEIHPRPRLNCLLESFVSFLILLIFSRGIANFRTVGLRL